MRAEAGGGGPFADLEEEFIDQLRRHAEVHRVDAGGAIFGHPLGDIERPIEGPALEVLVLHQRVQGGVDIDPRQAAENLETASTADEGNGGNGEAGFAAAPGANLSIPLAVSGDVGDGLCLAETGPCVPFEMKTLDADIHRRGEGIRGAAEKGDHSKSFPVAFQSLVDEVNHL